MSDNSLLGPWLRRFLDEYIVSERNLARNTQLSYRDTLVLLLPFIADKACMPVDRLTVRDLSVERLLAFLAYLEKVRGCSPRTRNQRLAAIRAFARHVATRSPEHVEWCGRVCTIPLKKAVPPSVGYLEKHELDALLGKGGKTRLCPLLRSSAQALTELIEGRAAGEAVFLNRRGHPITRSGIRQLVERCAAKAAENIPPLKSRKVGPHVLRHTAATHMLRSGVDLNTVRAWLGHVSLNTTSVYAEIDLERKAKAVALFDSAEPTPGKSYRHNNELMAYLRSL